MDDSSTGTIGTCHFPFYICTPPTPFHIHPPLPLPFPSLSLSSRPRHSAQRTKQVVTFYSDMILCGATTVPKHLAMCYVVITVPATCWTVGPHILRVIPCITCPAMFGLCGVSKFLRAVCWSGVPLPTTTPTPSARRGRRREVVRQQNLPLEGSYVSSNWSAVCLPDSVASWQLHGTKTAS